MDCFAFRKVNYFGTLYSSTSSQEMCDNSIQASNASFLILLQLTWISMLGIPSDQNSSVSCRICLRRASYTYYSYHASMMFHALFRILVHGNPPSKHIGTPTPTLLRKCSLCTVISTRINHKTPTGNTTCSGTCPIIHIIIILLLLLEAKYPTQQHHHV
jgi:hypothetical protein